MNLDFPPPQEQARVGPSAPAADASIRRPLWIWPFIAGASLALAGAAIAVALIDDNSSDPQQSIEYSVEEAEPASDAESDQDTVCGLEKKTLEIALEAWYAMNGTAADPTQDELVSSGLMRDTIDSYDFVRDGAYSVEVVPVADGRCD